MTKKLIAIDAGHGFNTSGKRTLKSIDPNQTREWYLNDRIADMVQNRLEAYDCATLRVDDTTGAKDISLGARVRMANSAGADMYISIHHNAGINGGAGGGTVVFYYADSEMKARAQRLYNAVVSRTGLTGNRGSKVAVSPFYVIKNTNMPALLLENGFMDSLTDTPIILTTAHAEKTAQGIVDFLVSELQLVKKTANGNVEESIKETIKEPGKEPGKEPSKETDDQGADLGAYYQAYTGKKTTLAPALASLGINSSYAFRHRIAAVNGIRGYVGTAAQNTQMYNLLAAGRLRRV